ncbi:hypothetical protein QYE76_011756 [Lolium multiflorum]|uniref:Uncharacterized protein n=1 Tax=Lolium multiflorum TaxID=4521 RepID=A0AAD8X5X5_LOLMU|nr:hypothetical protein QYE76_011756 [Lolium multiflorum]
MGFAAASPEGFPYRGSLRGSEEEQLVEKNKNRKLCDNNPGVMGATLCPLYDLVLEDPNAYKDLVVSSVNILKQVAERRLPTSYDYHQMPAPFIQSDSHNLKYMGIDALGRLIKINPDIAEEHQLAVINCLERPQLKISTSEDKLITSQIAVSQVCMYAMIYSIDCSVSDAEAMRTCRAGGEEKITTRRLAWGDAQVLDCRSRVDAWPEDITERCRQRRGRAHLPGGGSDEDTLARLEALRFSGGSSFTGAAVASLRPCYPAPAPSTGELLKALLQPSVRWDLSAQGKGSVLGRERALLGKQLLLAHQNCLLPAHMRPPVGTSQ